MNVHFIAIGGSVMHQLALAFLKKGYTVTGSDDEIFEPSKSNLEQAGVLVDSGWHPENIHEGLEAVILGMHAKMDNPELQRAIELGLKIYSFPEYIYQESSDKSRIVVGGSHGKTSTTAMIMHVMKSAGREAGINTADFTTAMSSFNGAAKRLEVLAENAKTVIFRDFAHAPSKLTATIQAVRRQFPRRKLVAVFELHTYSSLNEQFLDEFTGSMSAADEPAVVYSKHALKLKRLTVVDPEKIKKGFNRKDLQVFNDKEKLMEWMRTFAYDDANVLLMSSGNFDGADMLTFANQVTGSNN